MNTPRSPKECVEAVLANLEMAFLAKHSEAIGQEYGVDQRALGEALGYQGAITLIRTECASFLNPEHKDSSHA